MQYYIMYQGQVTGPMTKEQIFAYGVNRDTMVSAEGGAWRPLYTYPDLMEILSSGSAAVASGYQRQVGFGEAIKRGFSKYAVFTGRTSRSEFWWWQLFVFILNTILSSVSMPFIMQDFDPSSGMLPMSWYCTNGILSLILFLPNLGMAIRRLHDTSRSGWWVLLNLVCCIGWIFLLVWWCQPSQESDNKYGPVPNVE